MNLPPFVTILGVLIACYLIGSINFSLIAASLFLRRDIRKMGSQNAGFTNLLRAGNKTVALTVLCFDIARAYAVVYGCSLFTIEIFWPLMAIPMLGGNLWPVFHRFKGGKGIAMSIGIVFGISPLAGILGILAMIVLISLWKKVSLGSLGFLLSAAITILLTCSLLSGIMGILLVVFGVFSHRRNIARLVSGTEPTLF